MTVTQASQGQSVFEALGVRPVINCCGIYTDLGGSILAPPVWKAVDELNGSFVRMPELLDRCSEMVASLVGAEAARITPGASAALALAVGATMTRDKGPHWELLPDTTGLRNETIISAHHLRDYKYAVCVRMSGTRLVEAGPQSHFDLDAVLNAITDRTACVLVPAHLLDGFHGTEMLAQVVEGAHARGVPVVVDAAYMCYPTELMRSYAEVGADLTCFSAKYFYGPNTGGFVSGSAELVRSVAGLDFTRFESGPFKSFGRPFKMSRYDVAATALTLKRWFELDHEVRWAGYALKAMAIAAALPAVQGVTTSLKLFTMSEELVEDEHINCVALAFAPDAPIDAATVAARLEAGNPIIACVEMDGMLIVAVDALSDGDEVVVGARLAEVLLSSDALECHPL